MSYKYLISTNKYVNLQYLQDGIDNVSAFVATVNADVVHCRIAC